MSYSGPNLRNFLAQREAEIHSLRFQGKLYRERLAIAKNLYKYDLIAHYGCVNAIEFSNGGEFLISGGDDKRILLWNVEKAIAGFGTPRCMEKEHQSNIFCLSFSMDNSKILSGGNDELLIVHDFETGKVFDVYVHTKPVYGLCVDPGCDSIIASAGEDGRIIIFDQRKGTAVMSLGRYRAPFHAVQFHPMDGKFLVTANSKKGAALWDIRESTSPLISYGGEGNQQSCMSVRFNSNGNQVLALRRRLPPVLYNTASEKAVCQFYHPDYYNSCTMKSCCFAGEDDEFVLSGSDDFNLYVWRVGDVDLTIHDQMIEQTQMVLYGHRSIVNQVRYNPQKCIFASSGVEKIVKLWSPFMQKGWTGGLTEEASGPENPREVFSHNDYFSLIQMNWSNMTHDYSNQNTHEDPRMMAFFDSLIQQEIEGWDTNNTSDSEQISEATSENSTRQSSTEDSDNENLTYYTYSNDRSRRGTTNPVKPQRPKYANRIAYLIATKRNTLRRLALKGASQSNRKRQNSLKAAKRKNQNHTNRNSVRTTRNGSGGKRVGRYNSVSRRTRTRDEPDGQKIYRYKGATNTHLRSYRKKTKSYRADESSTDDDIPCTSGEITQDSSNVSSRNLAIPSTSTGITANGKERLRYLQQQLNDSDEDNSGSNSEDETRAVASVQNMPPRVLLNGVNNTHTTENNRVQSDIDDDRHSTPPLTRKRRAQVLQPVDIYSSHSNSRLSNSSYLEDENDTSSNESLDCFAKKRRAVPSTSSNPPSYSTNANETNSPTLPELTTPNDKRSSNNSPSDSGISSIPTPGCSSASSSVVQQCPGSSGASAANCTNGGVNSCSDEKFAIKLFQQKVARVRRNYRKKFGVKSDSD